MRDTKRPFLAFRYLVSPLTNQKTIIQVTNPSKEVLITNVLEELGNTKKTRWGQGAKTYLLFSNQLPKDGLCFYQLARAKTTTLYKEVDNQLEMEKEQTHAVIRLIVDTENQIILAERNMSSFKNLLPAIDSFAGYLRGRMKEFDYNVNIWPLTSPYRFWEYVEEADKSYSLKMKFNAPNMLLGSQDTREFLQKWKDEINLEEMEIQVESKAGLLDLKGGMIKKFMDYILEVGGDFIYSFMKDNVERKVTSYDDQARADIQIKESDIFSEEDRENILAQTKLLNRLSTREPNKKNGKGTKPQSPPEGPENGNN